MSESNFSRHACGIIKTMGGHVSKVEAAESASGIPDLDYCVAGFEGHIELKYGHKTKSPELRPSQSRWFRDRIKAGGKPFFLVLDGNTNIIHLIEGKFHKELEGKQSMPTWRKFASASWSWGDEFKQGLAKRIRRSEN